MRKIACSGLVIALLGLPMGLVTTGCSDNAGGNEDESINKTKGVVAPDAPTTQEDYQKQQQQQQKKP